MSRTVQVELVVELKLLLVMSEFMSQDKIKTVRSNVNYTKLVYVNGSVRGGGFIVKLVVLP